MSKDRPPSWAPDWSQWLSPPDTTHAEASSSNAANSSRRTSDKGEDEIGMRSSLQNTVAQQVTGVPRIDVSPEQEFELSGEAALYIEHDRDRDVKYVIEGSMMIALLTICPTDAV